MGGGQGRARSRARQPPTGPGPGPVDPAGDGRTGHWTAEYPDGGIGFFGADADGIVHATHAMLGTELGTAREVVSRTLSEFHRRGWIEQARGEVRLTDRDGLDRLVKTSGAQD